MHIKSTYIYERSNSYSLKKCFNLCLREYVSMKNQYCSE